MLVFDKNGQICEVIKPGMVLEFTCVAGKVATFTIRDGDGTLYETGTRQQ